jgi:uncharacterized DUF497 family protein
VFEFDWDDANLAHIARHGVSPEEAEECCFDTLALDVYPVDDEIRFEELGQTKTGRILKVVTTDRAGKLRIVTAFDATAREKQQFLLSQRNP